MTSSILATIRTRWASRKWPTIGYFVHGQAYQDIQELLRLVDFYKAQANTIVGKYPPNGGKWSGAIRANVEALPRYDAVIEWGDAFCEACDDGQYLRRDDVLALFEPNDHKDNAGNTEGLS